MSTTKRLATGIAFAMAAVLVPLAAPASAQTSVTLCATTGSVTLPGSGPVPVWSYVLGGCGGASGSATLPGEVITVPAGNSLSVTVENDLAEPVSFNVPTLPGAPDLDGIAPGGSDTYTWTAAELSTGTHLYESGMNPGVQIPMGLYGAIIVEPASPAADVEQLVLLSEVDVHLNADPAGFNRNDYAPEYFLINGQPAPGVPDVAAASGDQVLLRYVNAGTRAYSMSLLGARQTVVAKEGRSLPMTRNVVAELIPAGHTVDAIVDLTSAADGSRVVVYNRNGRLTNDLGGQSQGGMQFAITVGPGTGPTLPVMYTSFNGNSTIGGVAYRDEDILAYDNGSWSMFFDGSAAGIAGWDIDGLAVLGPDHVVISVRTDRPDLFPDIGTAVDDSDILEYQAGTWSMLLDGSTVGLTENGEDVDGVDVRPNGDILISIVGSATIPMAAGTRTIRDEDIAIYDVSAGLFARHVDGSDIGLNQGGGEDIDGFARDGNGDFVMTSTGDHTVPTAAGSLSGTNDDVFKFLPTGLGGTTSGLFANSHLFGAGQDNIDGLDVD